MIGPRVEGFEQRGRDYIVAAITAHCVSVTQSWAFFILTEKGGGGEGGGAIL